MNTLFLIPLSPAMLQLLVVISGLLIVLGGLIPKLRAWAVSILLFVFAYIALPPLLEPFLDVTPLWVLVSLLILLLLNVLCETLVLLDFFRGREKGESAESMENRQRSCIWRILRGVVVLPFWASWGLLRLLFRA